MVHFKAAWQRLLSHQQLKEVGSGNCVAQDMCPILVISSRIERQQPMDITTMTLIRSSSEEFKLSTDVDHDYCVNSMASLSLFVENVVVYIAGFVVRSVRKRLVCDTCSDALAKPRDPKRALKRSRDDLVLNGSTSDRVVSLFSREVIHVKPCRHDVVLIDATDNSGPLLLSDVVSSPLKRDCKQFAR